MSTLNKARSILIDEASVLVTPPRRPAIIDRTVYFLCRRVWKTLDAWIVFGMVPVTNSTLLPPPQAQAVVDELPTSSAAPASSLLTNGQTPDLSLDSIGECCRRIDAEPGVIAKGRAVAAVNRIIRFEMMAASPAAKALGRESAVSALTAELLPPSLGSDGPSLMMPVRFHNTIPRNLLPSVSLWFQSVVLRNPAARARRALLRHVEVMSGLARQLESSQVSHASAIERIGDISAQIEVVRAVIAKLEEEGSKQHRVVTQLGEVIREYYLPRLDEILQSLLRLLETYVHQAFESISAYTSGQRDLQIARQVGALNRAAIERLSRLEASARGRKALHESCQDLVAAMARYEKNVTVPDDNLDPLRQEMMNAIKGLQKRRIAASLERSLERSP